MSRSRDSTEWLYYGTWFDGFWRSRCAVVEAKGNHDFMFPDAPRTRPFFSDKVIADWSESYERQLLLVEKAGPASHLEWHFMQETSWCVATGSGLSPIHAKHTPPPSLWNR